MDRDAKITRSIGLRVLAGIIVLALLLVTVLARPGHGGMWLQTLGEYLHVPVFGIIAVSLLLITPSHWTRQKRLLVVFGLAIFLAVFSEIAQIPTPRDASIDDVIADLLGAAGFVAMAVVFSSSISIRKGLGRYLIILGLACIAWPMAPLVTVSAAYLERNQALPSIVRFDSRLGHTFFRLQNSDFRRVLRPDKNLVTAEISLHDAPWPGIIFHDLWPNWEPYSALIIEIENPGAESLPVHIRVHDHAHRDGDQPYGDRFNRSVDLAPGTLKIRISLSDIQNAPAGRQMNMAEIDGLVVFCTQQESGRKFVLYRVRLE